MWMEACVVSMFEKNVRLKTGREALFIQTKAGDRQGCTSIKGCPGLSISQVQQLQACQNKLLAWVCHRRGENSTRQNLKECNVLTVNQTRAFRVLPIGLTTLRTGRPRGLNDMIRRGKRGRGGMETRSEGNEVQRVCRSYFAYRTWRNNFLLLY